MKKTFINPHIKNSRRSLKDYLLWKVGYFDDETEKKKRLETFLYPNRASPVTPTAPAALWVNHSTFLLRVGGVSILTDPIWSGRCSPLPLIGPKRKHPPGIAFSELPLIDLVLISHNHYDHLDKKTVMALSHRYPKCAWLVPLGVKKWFDRLGIAPVCEMGWWDKLSLTLSNTPLEATAVPAQHFSGRKGYDLNSTLWAGWVLEIMHAGVKKKLYFAGDTGYNSFDFANIGKAFAPIDLSLIPIGCYYPRAFMGGVHVQPAESVKIHCDVGSKLSVGMHWKTFCLSDEPMGRPPQDLYIALQEANVDPSRFLVPDPGEWVNW